MSGDTSFKRTSLPVLIPLGIHAKNPPIKLGRPVYILGAKQNCRIHLVSSTVSNTHAVLVQTRHITYIRDLCSRTHVLVNNKEVKEAVLEDGDLLTIGRFQFRYQGPVKDHGQEPAVSPAALNVVGADTPVPLESRAIVIGRRPTCDVPLLEESVSTVHAVILQWEGHRFLRDLWSRSGTFVNGKAIHEVELKPGDHIRIGETEMTYAPSVDEVAFSLVEGASDSIFADTPSAEEVDLGKEIQPKVTKDQAPLELILTPKSPPPPEELLPLEADEAIEPTPHDTAHIPLSIEVESTGSSTSAPSQVPFDLDVIPIGQEKTALSKRGWRSSATEAEPAKVEPIVASIQPPAEPVKSAEPAREIIEPAREIIEPTQPTPESALAMPAADDTTPQPAPAANELTDTTFGRNIEEFEGDSLGPIVESADRSEPQIVSSDPVPAVARNPIVEEIEPTLTFPVEPAEYLATIDSSTIPFEPATEPLLEISPSDETPSLASLADDVVQPASEDEPAAEIPLLSDSLVSHEDTEPEIDLSPWPEKAIEPAIDDTPHAQPIAEAPILPLKSATIDFISPDEAVVEPGDTLEPISASLAVKDDTLVSMSSDSVVSTIEQVFVDPEPPTETDNNSVLNEEMPAEGSEPQAIAAPMPLQDETLVQMSPDMVEPSVLLEPLDVSLAEDISVLPINAAEASEPMGSEEVAWPSLESNEPATEEPVHSPDAELPKFDAGSAGPSAVEIDPVAVTSDEVEEVVPPVHAESLEELDTPAFSLQPSDVTRIADESFEPVESVASDSIPMGRDEINEAPVIANTEDAAMTILSTPESDSSAPLAEQFADTPPANESGDMTEPAIESSTTIDVTPEQVENPVDFSKWTPPGHSDAPLDEAAVLDFLASAEPATEAATVSTDSATEGQLTADQSAADVSTIETISTASPDEPALSIESPEEISSSPVLEPSWVNDAPTLDFATLAPADEVGEKIEESSVIDARPVETPSTAPTDETPFHVEMPEAIPSAPTFESSLTSDSSAHEVGEKIEETSTSGETPVEDVGTASPDESCFNIKMPEEISSAPTLESSLASDDSKIDSVRLSPADGIDERAEEPTLADDASDTAVPVLDMQLDAPIAPTPAMEAPPMSSEPVDLSAMATADESVAPVDESAALDFLTSTEPADEGQATIDESVVEPPPVAHFPDIKPPALLAEDVMVLPDAPAAPPISIPPVEDSMGGTMSSMPIVQPPPTDPPGDLDMLAIPIPRANKRGRRGARPRVIRNGFRQGPDALKPGQIEIPPFTEHAAGISAGESLQGLSQPPVRQADVFSDMPGAGAEVRGDVFSAGSSSESEADRLAQEVAKLNADDQFIGKIETPKRGPEISAKSPRSGARGIQPGFDFAPPRPVLPFEDPDAAAARRRRLLRRVPILMTVMILLIAGAWATIWFLVPMRTRIQATLVFQNFNSLTLREQHLTQAEQANRLGQESTRRTAIQKLQNRYPGIAPGFLDNPDQYGMIATNPDTHWPEDRVGEFVIRYDGTDPDEDKARVEAVALAMYDSNSQLANDAHSLKATLAKLTTDIDTAKRRIDEYKQQQDRERAIIDGRPSKDQLDKLKADDADYNAEYNIAISKFKDAQADLTRMTEQQKAAAATTAPADPTAGDAELAKMSQDASTLAAQIESARKDRIAMAAKARETLDSAYDDFKKQVESAQGTVKDNPELAAYVTAAQNTQQAIRDITDQYIQHQQDEYGELNGLKNDIMAKMQQRKTDLMANDPKLKDLNDQKEIATRKYNAAVGQGLDKDASDFQNDLKLLDTAIKAQQEIVSNDPVYNEMITRLQQLIDQKQHTVDGERKRTEEKLAELKSSFNKSAPAVEKMPAEQKELASAMQDRLVQLDAARRQYAEAANTAAADADSSVKSMTEQLQTLQMNIQVRKKQILADKPNQQEQDAALAAQTTLVNQLDVARNTARMAYEQNQANLRKAVAATDEARASAQRLEEANSQRDQFERQLEQNKREWDAKKAQADRAIEPVEPTSDSVITLGDPIKERRNTVLTYGSFSSLGIFVVFAGWIMLTLLGAARESHETRGPKIETLETPISGHDLKTDDAAEPEENEAAVA